MPVLLNSSLLCHNQVENLGAEAFVEPGQEVTMLAQDKLARIDDLEDMLPIYDEYPDSGSPDIEVALNSLCQNLQVACAITSPPPKPPDSTKGSGYTRSIYS